jgi:hypothetical protein
MVLLLLLIGNYLTAQKNTGIRFSSCNSVGIIAGKAPVAFTAQTVNGIRYKKWFAGIGFGIDDYFIKSLPLFASVRRDFITGKFSFFLYADAGGQFIVHPNNNTIAYYKHETYGGVYLDGGAGIKLPVAKTKSIFISFGNTFKRITNKTSSTLVEYPSEDKTVSSLSRLSIRLGFQF